MEAIRMILILLKHKSDHATSLLEKNNKNTNDPSAFMCACEASSPATPCCFPQVTPS